MGRGGLVGPPRGVREEGGGGARRLPIPTSLIHHRTSMYTTVSPSCQFASRTESVTRYL